MNLIQKLVSLWALSLFFVSISALAQDATLNDEARILGGLLPVNSDLARLLENTSFDTFRKNTDNDWNQGRTVGQRKTISAASRLDIISAWSARKLGDFNSGCETLFYPFGGADILNAQKFFPNCRRYLLIGFFEKVGTFPNLSQILKAGNTQAFDAYLAGARASQKELFEKGFIVTKNTVAVQSQTKINGNTALIAYLLARGGNVVDRIDTFCLSEDLMILNAPSAYAPSQCEKSNVPGVRILFRDSLGTKKEVIYLKSNLSNAVFADRSITSNYITQLKNQDGHDFVTMLKAASYCLHDENFSRIRDFIFNSSRFILQDASGIPYPKINQRVWNVQLFGDYTKPVPAFEKIQEPELRKAYYPDYPSGGKRLDIPSIPFNYGYNTWRASLMVLRKF